MEQGLFILELFENKAYNFLVLKYFKLPRCLIKIIFELQKLKIVTVGNYLEKKKITYNFKDSDKNNCRYYNGPIYFCSKYEFKEKHLIFGDGVIIDKKFSCTEDFDVVAVKYFSHKFIVNYYDLLFSPSTVDKKKNCLENFMMTQIPLLSRSAQKNFNFLCEVMDKKIIKKYFKSKFMIQKISNKVEKTKVHIKRQFDIKTWI